ncbi:hypothetical protein SAMN05421759_11130 [Roseivivax lentus]|uniref:Cytochrome c domain-containing protein n=1 Tax=Roseivivax lentus TaxID=633194 RepID=A0A1N7NYA8_9RHOB|nr:hypothetical protein [Roseivivax lentus]SIT03355.1 hypothetical protein SAMN05421759_11130 [Roseivivax lentus]
MKRLVPLGLPLLAALALPINGTARAQDVDAVFDFIPAGGRTLLEKLRAGGLPESLSAAIAGPGADVAAWQETLETARAEAPAIAALDSWEADTLAHYLAWRAPFDAGGGLPRDGRDLSLQLCQSCHIITVVVTQDRTREAWLGTMNSPSHVEIEMSDAERQLLADYLVLNAAIPIDLVPPELRAGGASY